MPRTIDPEIPDGTDVSNICTKDGHELEFESGVIRDVSTGPLADYSLRLVVGPSGTKEFMELQQKKPKFRAKIVAGNDEEYSCAILLSRISFDGAMTRIQAHIEFYDDEQNGLPNG